MPDEDEAGEYSNQHRSLLKHPVVMAALIGVIGGLPTAAIANLGEVRSFIDQVLGPSQITYVVEYTNTGAKPQQDYHVSAILPEGAEYVRGSSYYRDGDVWKPVTDGIVSDNGLELAELQPKFTSAVSFTAHLGTRTLHSCSPEGLTVEVRSKSKDSASSSSIQIYADCS